MPVETVTGRTWSETLPKPEGNALAEAGPSMPSSLGLGGVNLEVEGDSTNSSHSGSEAIWKGRYAFVEVSGAAIGALAIGMAAT
jgi:hypothetical protein